MKSGASQLVDWMKRRWPESTRPAMETANLLGWDITFISKIVNGERLPGLINALKLERETGIPVEAWVPSEVDKAGDLVALPARKSKQTR